MNYEHNLVDFHCHLDLYPEFERLIVECENNKIRTLAVTTTPRAWPRNRDLIKNLQYVRPALGFHPQLVDQHFQSELTLWESYLPETYLIGEVGLDGGPNFVKNFDYQTRVFRRILECCAVAGGKVLSIHSIKAAGAVLDLIKELNSPSNKYVFHWFSGTIGDLSRAVEFGCYFSVNSAMLASTKGKQIVKSIPIDRLLTESDGPFVTTRSGSPATPKDTSDAMSEIEALLGVDRIELSKRINTNLQCLVAN
ncbi:MAG: Qat anti-phage system TatD family nuclease QatD [Pyrinomonadaceae bacterium]